MVKAPLVNLAKHSLGANRSLIPGLQYWQLISFSFSLGLCLHRVSVCIMILRIRMAILISLSTVVGFMTLEL